MCDYSLQHVQSRPAKVGDRLVSSCFERTNTRGFAAAEEPTVVVCLRPGTELAFDTEITCDSHYGFLFSGRKWPHKVARFRRVDEDQLYAHHDALELPDGESVLLNQLQPGQRATVLQSPAPPISVRADDDRVTEPTLI